MALAGLLAGCTISDDTMARLLVAPDKYQFFNCDQLAAQIKSTLAREKELEQLMARAEVDPAGRLVSTVAYKSDYLTARGDLNELRQSAAAKNCAFLAGHVSDRTIR
jgi:hypothetical protein